MKYGCKLIEGEYGWSPPSRGAWIEITMPLTSTGYVRVAPLAGGVD